MAKMYSWRKSMNVILSTIIGKMKISNGLVCVFAMFATFANAQLKATETEIGLGWSNNSVNTVIFRNNAVTSFKNIQFAAYYDPEGKLVLAKRKLHAKNWKKHVTPYKGNVKDAHNAISIAVDAAGYLHVSWDHHNTRLRYALSKKPLCLELGEEIAMTGTDEDKVTYPEFHNLPDGQLLFCYRSGASGRGNMVVKTYDVKTKKWTQLQNNLLDGQNQRSAYWQMHVGEKGIYLSWVWRESWDVSTNNDICYAFSADGGKTWEKSNGEKYALPINKATAEIAWKVPQKSSLINQTSMTTDEHGNPYIASYWDNNGVPQYKVVYLTEGKWQLINTDFHKNAFYLGGGGTKRIPISRPEILVDKVNLYLLFRDEERENKITLAHTNLKKIEWDLADLTSYSVGQWEPNFDKELWEVKKELNIFSQNVSQADGEGLTEVKPEPVRIIALKKLPVSADN